jgi:hypothetical protein
LGFIGNRKMSSNAVILALEEQVGCYRRLARLAEAQHEHVQQMQMEPLLEVLKSRQQVLDRLKCLDELIAPAKQRWTLFLSELAADLRARAEGIVLETRRLLEQITVADRNDAMVLQQRKLNIGREIHQASAARQINRTYGAAAYGAPAARMDVQR